MRRTGVIERAVRTGIMALVLSHGVATSSGAVEVPRPDRVVSPESADARVWRACRAHGERALPMVEVEVGNTAGDAGLARAVVLFALKIREQQLRAFTATCMRAAGFGETTAMIEDAQSTREPAPGR